MILYDRRLPKPTLRIRVGVSRDDPNLENNNGKLSQQQQDLKKNNRQQQQQQQQPAGKHRSTDLFDDGKFVYKICCSHIIDNFTTAPQFSKRLEELTAASARHRRSASSFAAVGDGCATDSTAADLMQDDDGDENAALVSTSRLGSARRPVSAFTNASHQLHPVEGNQHDRRPTSATASRRQERPSSGYFSGSLPMQRRDTPIGNNNNSEFIDDGDYDDDDGDVGDADLDASFEAIVKKHQEQQSRSGNSSRPFSSSIVSAKSRSNVPPLNFSREFLEASGLPHSQQQQQSQHEYSLHERTAASSATAFTDEIIKRRRETNMIVVPVRRPLTASVSARRGCSSRSGGRKSAAAGGTTFLTDREQRSYSRPDLGGALVAAQMAESARRQQLTDAAAEADGHSASRSATPTVLTKSMIFLHAAATLNREKEVEQSCSSGRSFGDSSSRVSSQEHQRQHPPLSRGKHLGYSDVLAELQLQAAAKSYALTVQSHLGEKKKPMRIGKRYNKMAVSPVGGGEKKSCRYDDDDVDFDDDDFIDDNPRATAAAGAAVLLDSRPDVVSVRRDCILKGSRIPITAEEKMRAAMENNNNNNGSSSYSPSYTSSGANSRAGTPVIFRSSNSPSGVGEASAAPRRVPPCTSSLGIKHEHPEPPQSRHRFQPRPPAQQSKDNASVFRSRSLAAASASASASAMKIPAPPRPLSASSLNCGDAAVDAGPSPMAASTLLGSTTTLASSPSSSLSASLKNKWLAEGSLSTSQIYNKKRAAVFHQDKQQQRVSRGSALSTPRSSSVVNTDAAAKKSCRSSVSGNLAAAESTSSGMLLRTSTSSNTNRIASPRELREQRLNSARCNHYLNGKRWEKPVAGSLGGLHGTKAVSERPASGVDALPRSARF